jgi:hypothetical protein
VPIKLVAVQRSPRLPQRRVEGDRNSIGCWPLESARSGKLPRMALGITDRNALGARSPPGYASVPVRGV